MDSALGRLIRDLPGPPIWSPTGSGFGTEGRGAPAGASSGGGAEDLSAAVRHRPLPPQPRFHYGAAHGGRTLVCHAKISFTPRPSHWLEGRGKLLPASNCNAQWAREGQGSATSFLRSQSGRGTSKRFLSSGVGRRWRPPKGVGACARC